MELPRLCQYMLKHQKRLKQDSHAGQLGDKTKNKIKKEKTERAAQRAWQLFQPIIGAASGSYKVHQGMANR